MRHVAQTNNAQVGGILTYPRAIKHEEIGDDIEEKGTEPN